MTIDIEKTSLDIAPQDNVSKDTLNLEQVASYFHMNKETARRMASKGLIPGCKLGKRWVFLKIDLDEFIRSKYSKPRQALLSESTKGDRLCHLSNAEKRGGSHSPHQTGSELDALLKQL